MSSSQNTSILQVLNSSSSHSRGGVLSNHSSPNLMMNHHHQGSTLVGGVGLSITNGSISPSLHQVFPQLQQHLQLVEECNHNYGLQKMLQQQEQIANQNYNLSMQQGDLITRQNQAVNMTLSPNGYNYLVTNSTSPTLSPNSSHTNSSSSNSSNHSNNNNTNNLMFINETTADVLQRGVFPNYDLSAPSTPKRNLLSSGSHANGFSTPQPSNTTSTNPLKSPPSLKTQKQHSASTLHTATSLRMKKHSGLGNFKNNYFELEMKKTPKSHSSTSQVMTAATASVADSNTTGVTPNNGSPARRGIEKSSSFSKKNPLLNLDRHSLAAALSQSNLLQPNQQLQEVGNKKFSLSYNELNSEDQLSSLYGQPHALIGQALHQHVLNPNNGLFMNGNGSMNVNNANNHASMIDVNMNDQNSENSMKRNRLLTYSVSSPNLLNSHAQQQQPEILLSQPYQNLSYFAQQQGIFQQMSTSYPVKTSVDHGLQQSSTSHTNQVSSSQPKDTSDFDDMLESLLNEDCVFEESITVPTGNNNGCNLNNAKWDEFDTSASQHVSSPLSIFAEKDDHQQDMSLLLDMDNFFLSSGNDDAGMDQSAKEMNEINATANQPNASATTNTSTHQDQNLPLRPLNPQDVMKEWENICSHNNHHHTYSQLGAHSPTHLNNLEYDLLDQF
ncbi:hypothetical protein FDP41_011140 [Naegleria fowleri]|uniref:Uncharacterized protein n=1 Tax=Naegleria fowleri TaxID=5763 RepID=A0A6A5C8A9_NAEFO|nr:uncharacterized protein FDP41_011140 [Naegleria fowleri]KAF0983162.1 hypothetical protein FDP41_011140 [Naegleria fowleri]